MEKLEHINDLISTYEKPVERLILCGRVLSVQDGIVVADGLQDSGLGQIVEFRSEPVVLGIIATLETEFVRITLLGPDNAVKVGDIVLNTELYPEVVVGFGVLGRVIDALGRPIDGLGELTEPPLVPNTETETQEKNVKISETETQEKNVNI